MYYILILCIIRGQPVMFQDMKGQVFLIGDEVSRKDDVVNIPRGEFLTLVDADDEFCKPDPYLLDFINFRVLLTSPPRSRTDRKWLTQYVKDSSAVYIMEPWSREELLLTSFVYSFSY